MPVHRYATAQNLIDSFGEVEMRRVSVVDGDVPETVLPERLEAKLDAATDIADSYLRGRYLVPLAPVPPSIVQAVCKIARYELASGGDRTPSDSMTRDRDAVIAWLKSLSTGVATLEGAAPVATASGARFSDRERAFSSQAFGGW
jgi:phage gp36-like protein